MRPFSPALQTLQTLRTQSLPGLAWSPGLQTMSECRYNKTTHHSPLLLRCCAVFGDQYHRTTVLSNGFSWQGMRPTREGLPLLHLLQAGKGSTQSRWSEVVWLWCAHPLRADPVRSGDAQHLNGQGHATNRLEGACSWATSACAGALAADEAAACPLLEA